ncbi:SGNH/GDSL hydrolase family protein [bacterium]|nr:SGNH/GDSL hydrolase family protein [FCB group bacterium]MBL7191215.1 SGNH/GDSL hydrolase family protein [bacterium]
MIELRAANTNADNQIQLWFSEPIDPVSASDTSNFYIDGLPVLSSYQENDSLGVDRVILETIPMIDQIYTVEIEGLISADSNNTMNPDYSEFSFNGWRQVTTYYQRVRWMGDSMGFGNFTIYFEPSNTLYNRLIYYIEAHQQGTGIQLDEENFSVPGANALSLITGQLPGCISDEPDLAIVEIGGNDWPFTPFGRYLRQLDYILGRLASDLPETKVWVANFHEASLNVYPHGGGGFTFEQWMEGIKRIADRYDCPVLDIYNLLHGHTEPSGWYIGSDGIHPNTCGYVYMSTLALDLLEKTPPKPMNFSVSAVGSGRIIFDCQFYPGDVTTTAAQIFQDGEYLLTVERGNFPYTIPVASFDHVYRARNENDSYYPEIHYSAFTPEVSVDALSGFSSESVTLQPSEFKLHPPSPNPFNPVTIISFELPEDAFVKLAVFDISGREIVNLAEGWLNEGSHERVFDGTGLSSGMYFARLQTGDMIQTEKMLLIK